MNEDYCKMCNALWTSGCSACTLRTRLELSSGSNSSASSRRNADDNSLLRRSGRDSIHLRTYHDDTTSFESVPDAVTKSESESIAVEFGDQRVEFYLNSGECVEFNINGRHFKFERNRR